MSDASTEEYDKLFWRDEVMEAAYWMLGEGIEEAVAPADLRGFLDAPPGVIDDTFADLAAVGQVRERVVDHARRRVEEPPEVGGRDGVLDALPEHPVGRLHHLVAPEQLVVLLGAGVAHRPL